MIKEKKKTAAFSFMAAICFSGSAVFSSITDHAVSAGVFFGTVFLLTAAFFANHQNAEE